MTNPDPETRPPFQRHWLYYLILKIAVVAAAVAIALRYAEVI
ncbi:hypothetical protein ACO2I3_19780 [Leptospira interrogans]|jgi:hypothetical protein